MKTPTELNTLLAEHAELYKEFLPTLNNYAAMAKRALELQKKIYGARLRERYPEALFDDAPLIVSISARETPAKVGAIMDELFKKQIDVDSIIYDPQTFTFHLYGA